MSSGADGADSGAPRTRLIITHMTLENFKSYAGVQQIGPFHKVGARDPAYVACAARICPGSLLASSLLVCLRAPSSCVRLQVMLAPLVRRDSLRS